MARTRAYSFGASTREAHDASQFYSRNLYSHDLVSIFTQLREVLPAEDPKRVPGRPREEWVNRIFCHCSEYMRHIPDGAVGLAFTSPPYIAGKDYDDDLVLLEYLTLIAYVGREVFRGLTPGGRYVINLANLGR